MSSFSEKNNWKLIYSVFQSAEVQKLWVLGKRQEKYVYLTSLGNAISQEKPINVVISGDISQSE